MVPRRTGVAAMSQEPNEIVAGPGHGETSIKVTITYLAARKPAEFVFPANTTLEKVKQAAMDEFRVTEGPTPDGQSRIVFFLYDDEQQLTDLSRTIGDIADHSRHVKLKLVKQIIQGC
jgi:hypothetical protein